MAFSAPFLAWLRASANHCLIAEFGARVAGVETTLYQSTTGFVSSPTDAPANQVYNGRISGGGVFTRKLDLTGSGASISSGDLEFDNRDGQLDDWKTYTWSGRTIILYLGDPDGAKAAFELVFTGTIDDMIPKSRTVMVLKLRDIFGPLNTTLSTATVGGAGDIDNKGALRPVCLGECFNVTPVLIDATVGGGKYAVHLAAPIEGTLEVRDNGIPVAATQSAAVGTFTLTNARYGTITADVQGATVAGAWRNDAGGLIEWVAKALVGDGNSITAGQIDAARMTAFRAACAQPLGLYLTGRENKLQVMQRLAASVGATVTTTYDGKLMLVRVGLTGSPVGSIGTHNMVDGTFAPVARTPARGAIRIAGERNWTPNQSLAGSISQNAENVSILSDEFVTLATNDATVIANWYQSNTPAAVESLMVVQADITTELARLLALWKDPHAVYGFDGYPELLAYEIGDLVTLTHPRFGLSGGATGQIVGIKNDWITPRVSLEVLV